MHAYLLAKIDSSKEAYGKVDITYYGVAPPPFDVRGDFLHMCGWEDLLDFKNEECVVFDLLFGRTSASPPSCFGVSVHRGGTPAAQPGTHLSPCLITSWVS